LLTMGSPLHHFYSPDLLHLSPLTVGLLLCGGLAFAWWQHRAWQRERALKDQLQRSMRWLEGAQKAAKVGCFAYDMDRRVFEMSTVANEVFGLPQAEVFTLKKWLSCMDPAECQDIFTRHDQAMSSRGSLRIEYRFRRFSDQQVRWVQVWGEFEGEDTPGQPARMIGTVQDITDRKQAEQDLAAYRAKLEETVRLDPLTQVANRRALNEQALAEWRRARRSQLPLSILMIDVDHFKAYNDHYGHVAGDDCLQQVVHAMNTVLSQEGALLARYGGEEFVALLPHCDVVRAQSLGARLCAAVRGAHIPHARSATAPVMTISIGAASTRPAWGSDAMGDEATRGGRMPAGLLAMFEQADAALYLAKQQGRDRVACHTAHAAAA
ncbi:MAG TPA: sensor domain-containing diguanylate cyclase, partial [Aquabacterium sp.]|nr:sensor domain-containing diguanylate cyclase [Aquabacterium sp.]